MPLARNKDTRVAQKERSMLLERQMSRSESNRKFIDDRLKSFNPKMDRLRDLDLLVLDNSIRETTVGQLRGHTLEDKFAIYEEVKKCGFKYCIVESFHSMTRVGDKFLQLLKDKGEDMSHMFAFTDFVEVIDENKVPQDDLPIGYIKSKKFGLKNLIIEVDLAYHGIDYKVFNKNRMFALLVQRLQWVYENLGSDAKILINFRDWGNAMNFYPCRVFRLIHFICKLPNHARPFGVMVEELGKYLPEEVAVWTEALRREMDHGGWTDGHLLAHVHEQWGMADVTQLDMLAAGANGIWAGLCEEGAAMGHASSCITAMNLIRLGNTRILDKYNCLYLREAAVNVTRITTGHEPRPKQPVYGVRSLDLIFGLDTAKSRWDFNFADYLGVKPEMRITTLASPEMIVMKLKDFFGENEQFTLGMGKAMKEKMLEKLRNNIKEEANSMVGLAMLFDQSGGQLTDEMAKIIDEDKSHSVHIGELINKIKERWDVWDVSDGVQDNQITFDAFYNGFMAPYFGCYRCEDTQKGLSAIDMDNDGAVEWKEFALYLKWAGRQFPDCKTEEELLDMAFRKGLIPAMQDVLLPPEEQNGQNGVGLVRGSRNEGPATVTKRNTIIRRNPSVFYDQQVQKDAFFDEKDGEKDIEEVDENDELLFEGVEALELKD